MGPIKKGPVDKIEGLGWLGLANRSQRSVAAGPAEICMDRCVSSAQ